MGTFNRLTWDRGSAWVLMEPMAEAKRMLTSVPIGTLETESALLLETSHATGGVFSQEHSQGFCPAPVPGGACRMPSNVRKVPIGTPRCTENRSVGVFL